jgi:hypothetical protein
MPQEQQGARDETSLEPSWPGTFIILLLLLLTNGYLQAWAYGHHLVPKCHNGNRGIETLTMMSTTTIAPHNGNISHDDGHLSQ